MGDQFKLDDDGNCPSCSKLSGQGEFLKCFTCKANFHVVCSVAGNDDKVATKTTISSFSLSSTKKNFVFYCDRCLTELEISLANSDEKRINVMESKMTSIEKQLSDISSMLKDKMKSETKTRKQNILPEGNIWANKERLEVVKAPEPKAALVISSTDPVKNALAQDIVEKVVVENSMSLLESRKNNNGDLVLVCQSTEARDELRSLVQTANKDIPMNSPKAKHVSITLVGLGKAYTIEEIIKMLSLNEFIKSFCIKNKLEDHIKIHAVKPLRNKPSLFQAFASVSPVLRDGLRQHKDSIVVGLSRCKVYERKQVRRCNNCQLYGHIANACPTPTIPHCGKCSENHRTDQCESSERKCINCARVGESSDSHPAYFYHCPVLLKYLKDGQKTDSLNSNSTITKEGT